jgi:isocitrate/isopropylmalate dehydrogenase
MEASIDSPIRIAVLPGDGIGPEIIRQALKTLEIIEKKTELPIDLVSFPYGAEYFLKHQIMLPEELIAELRDKYSAVVMGTLGDKRVSNSRVREMLARLRSGLDLFVGLNQVKIYAEHYFPLKNMPEKPVDILLMRELLIGSQPRPGGTIFDGTPEEVTCDTFIETAHNVHRFIKAALNLAEKYQRTRIILVHKSNLYPYSAELWSRLMATECEAKGLAFEQMHAEVLMLEVLNAPDKFNCIITPSIFGETIYTPLLYLQGGIGLAHLCELNPQGIGVFRVTQGSAPTLVGRGFANPLGVFILLGELFRHLQRTEIATAIENAIRALMKKRLVTFDLGGMMPTEEVGNYFAEFVAEELAQLGVIK